jgi:hypothetical protein
LETLFPSIAATAVMALSIPQEVGEHVSDVRKKVADKIGNS